MTGTGADATVVDGTWRDSGSPVRGTVHPVRRAITLGLLVAVPLVVGGVEAGGFVALRSAGADAGSLAAQHRYPEAVGAWRATAERRGPVYLLGRALTPDATAATERTQMDWARSLAAAGNTDGALAVLDGLRAGAAADDPTAADARRASGDILLDAARRAAAADHSAAAVGLLDRLRGTAPGADTAAAAAALRLAVTVPAGVELTAAGDGVRAVALLDEATTAGGSTAAAAAPALPAALLAAGRQLVARGDAPGAREALHRLLTLAPRSTPGTMARSLLAQPHPVTGTLLRADGMPAAGVAVRLAGGFRRVGSVDFTLAGPFFTTRTDRRGDFRLSAVPLDSPVVFQFLDADGWALIVDDSHAPAYQVTPAALAPTDLGFIREP